MKTSKKIVAAALAAALSIGGLGLAIATPYVDSKTTADMYGRGGTNVDGVTVHTVTDTADPLVQRSLGIANRAVNDMRSYPNMEAYYRAQPNGEQLLSDIRSYTGEGELDVNEVTPFVVEGDTEGKGDIEFDVYFPTKYREGAEVAVVIGVETADGTIEWHVFKGVGNAEGGVVFTLNSEKDKELLKASSEGKAVISVASTPGAIAEPANATA